MTTLDRLYLGTWQYGGQFKKMTSEEIEGLVEYALASGIERFDTAAVYGGGSVETVLGDVLPADALVVTKIPAIKKPALTDPALAPAFYNLAAIQQSVEGSLSRLKRSQADVILLHNWLPHWTTDNESIIEAFVSLKVLGLTKKVGLSLPNQFAASIHSNLLPHLDVVEAPYNDENRWIVSQIPQLHHSGIEVILRSLFLQGKTVSRVMPTTTIKEAMQFKTSLVIGMTTRKQIKANIETMR